MTRSIQSLPNNSGTTSITEVYSSTGFSAGDPVYFQNNDYKSPANLTPPSTVNIPFTPPAAINPGGAGGIVAPAFTYAQMQTGIAGGTTRRFAAVLTDGNIVQVWFNYNLAPSNANRPYFRVVNSSGAVVVSPTLISATYQQTANSSISVAALTGGGFAVGWINNSGGTTNTVNYAVYGNTGTLVTAATQDTSFSLSGSSVPIEMVGLANGGFSIAAKSTSAVVFLRSYNATGVGAYSTINTGITASLADNSFALTARSDSSVFVCDRTNSNAYNYALYNSSGAAIVSSTSFSIPASVNAPQTCGGPDASVLSDGTTIVIGFNSHNGTYGYPAFRFLPTGNTLSAETIAIPIANLFYQTTYAGGYIGVQSLSSGGFIMFFSDGYGNMQYAFYNSSGVCVSGSNTDGAVPLQVNGGYSGHGNRVTLLESSGSVHAYWTSVSPTQRAVQQVYCKISTSSYTITPVSSTTGTAYVVSNQPTGAYIPSTVTPTSLSYYTTASSLVAATNAPATVTGPTVISTTACDAIASCTLTNGNFVVAWRASSGYTVYANVYSPTGTPITTITVGTGSSGGVCDTKVAALSGGGFVVAYSPNSNLLALSVYSSSYLFSTTTSFAQYSFNTAYNYDIAGLQDNKFVVAYMFDSNNCRTRVYDSSLTSLQSNDYSNGPVYLSVSGNPWGGFSFSAYFNGFGYQRFYTYWPTGTNTWATPGAGSLSSLGAYVQNPQMVTTQSGMNIVTGSSSSYISYGMFTSSTAAVEYIAAMSSWPLGSGSQPVSYTMMGIGMTGNGNVVIATSYSGSSLGIACLPAQMTFSNGQNLPYDLPGAGFNVPMFSFNGYSNLLAYDLNAQPRVTPGVGDNAIITFKGASQYPNFLIVNGTSNTSFYSVVAGTTPSAPVSVVPTTSTTSISGILAGVAVTSATAGSTGQLAVGGQVLLGSSYTSATTGAFDSTGQAVSGVKGTFNGRSINIQGNT